MMSKTDLYVKDLETEIESLRVSLAKSEKEKGLYQKLLDNVILEIQEKYDEDYETEAYDPKTHRIKSIKAIEKNGDLDV